jgi:hypothetical protein
MAPKTANEVFEARRGVGSVCAALAVCVQQEFQLYSPPGE